MVLAATTTQCGSQSRIDPDARLGYWPEHCGHTCHVDLETSRSDIAAIISVSGFMDVEHGYRVYQAAATEAVAGFSTVVLDLAGIEFIDSVGLGMLIRTRDELANNYESRLVLRNPSPYVTRLLELTGLQGEFDTAS